HGLPTEHKVMEKHKLETKEDIIKFGMDKFIKECLEFSTEMAGYMVKDLQRLGISLNMEDPYMPIKKEFIEGEWQLIKKAHEQNRIYYGEKVLTWCANCETALAKHECEYQNVEDNSIFVKFPVKGKKDEFIVIWTTTPWTLPFNLAVMVNPNLEYVRAKVENEVWILAKALAGPFVQAVADKQMEIIEEFTGDKLEGLEYEHPWMEELPELKKVKQENKKVFTIILSEEYVDTSAGTGLVHCAPGCGPEDQEAAKPYQIIPFNNLGEDGVFPEGMGKFSGLKAKKDDPKFVADLKEKGNLIAITQVEHEYPHCWRCHKPVIFRITYQWFMKIEDIREKMLLDNAEVHWIPETANNSFKSWVSNLRDNSISRQRFWGTPLPIWRCSQCEEYDVLGSVEELKEKSGKEPQDLHRPWVDEIKYGCSCGGEKRREPDVIDVWVDSGTTSWNCLNNDPKLIKEWFPADLVLEAKEQTRLWFSMLSICSQIAFGKNCYDNVYVHGMLTDVEGKKMSKSLGNIISPYEMIDKHGSDVLRYYMCQNNAGSEINFSWDECKIKERNLRVLWNVHKLLIDLAKENNTNPFGLDGDLMENILDLEEKYIFSKLNATLKKVTDCFDKYELDDTIVPLEELFLELSRTYIQIIREKSAVGSKADKDICMYAIRKVLLECIRAFAPVIPFISEAIYQNFKEEFGLDEESVHHLSWPSFDSQKIDPELEEQMETAKNVIQTGLNLREQLSMGVRWPLGELVVASKDKKVILAVERLRRIIEKQLNVREISIMEELPGVETKLTSDFKKLAPVYKELTAQVIAKLSMDSSETILGHLEKEGSYEFEIEGRKVSIKREDLIIENTVPEAYKEGKFKGGFVYLNKVLNEELEGEGYAREIMRQVQQMRKEAGLQKKERIFLYLKLSEGLLELVKKFENDIKEKVGAEKIGLGVLDPVKKHQCFGEKKVKKEKFGVFFDKV
ncbi:MAG: isoleucine--tRNA ligase, partial [Candidatus Woesearchaeota archaeon]